MSCLAWIEQLVAEIEAALEKTGILGRLGRGPRDVLLTWWATRG